MKRYSEFAGGTIEVEQFPEIAEGRTSEEWESVLMPATAQQMAVIGKGPFEHRKEAVKRLDRETYGSLPLESLVWGSSMIAGGVGASPQEIVEALTGSEAQ